LKASGASRGSPARRAERELDAALDVLDDVSGPTADGNFRATCPAHDDHEPSLSIKAVNGRILFHCFGGCAYTDIRNAINERQRPSDGDEVTQRVVRHAGGVIEPACTARVPTAPWPKRTVRIKKASGGFPKPPRKIWKFMRPEAQSSRITKCSPQASPPAAHFVTLEQLATAKKLPVKFLRDECRVTPGYFGSGVHIQYFGFTGDFVARKWRFKLKAKEGSKWPFGVPLAIYGEWRVQRDLQRNRGKLFIVEGESDCWTLWHQGYAALGIPGASNAKLLQRAHFIGVRDYIVIAEADHGGITFERGLKRRLRELGIS
jgi:hypothetical protein